MDKELIAEGYAFSEWMRNVTPEELAKYQSVSVMVNLRTIEVSSETQSLFVEFDIGKQFCNFMGFVHGGIIATMLDECIGATAFTRVGRGFRGTLKTAIEYHRPIPAGKVHGKGRVVAETDRDLTIEAQLFDLEGNLLADATSTVRYGAVRVRPTEVPAEA